MARSYPTTTAEFRRIPGVGEQKLKDFAEPFLTAITEYLQSNPRQTFDPGSAPPPRRRLSSLSESESETLRRFQDGQSMDAIARARGFVRGTISIHLAAAIEAGAELSLDQFLTPDQQAEIAVAYGRIGGANLAGLRDSLGGRFPYEELRIFRAFANRL